jgi:hypothetical protein
MSAFKISTYTAKGYTEEEAIYQIKIRRPTNVEYFMNKFSVDYDTAYHMRTEHQQKSAKISAARPIEEQRKTSVRCKEYWIENGFSEDDAINKVKEVQTTFSKEKCIEKLGLIDGTKLWEERQNKWQSSINSKSSEELAIINSKKSNKNVSVWRVKYGDVKGTEMFKLYLLSNNMIVIEDIADLEKYVISKIQPFHCYLPIKKIKSLIAPYMWSFINKPNDIDAWLNSFINFKAPEGKIIFKSNSKYGIKHGHYNMYVEDKILRSSNEIYFYQLLCEYGLVHNKDYLIEKYYDNCKLRCDFYLIKYNLYIELAGETTDVYVQKMKYKESTFNAKILWHQRDYKSFLENILI